MTTIDILTEPVKLIEKKRTILLTFVCILGEHPLHVAVRLMREDVVFLCLVENDQSVSRI